MMSIVFGLLVVAVIYVGVANTMAVAFVVVCLAGAWTFETRNLR